MIGVSLTGIILLVILAVVGGGMTGLFAGYMYQLARHRFGLVITIALNLLYYVVPVWALLSLGSEDGLMWFYLVLLVFFYAGVVLSIFPRVSNDRRDNTYDTFD